MREDGLYKHVETLGQNMDYLQKFNLIELK